MNKRTACLAVLATFALVALLAVLSAPSAATAYQEKEEYHGLAQHLGDVAGQTQVHIEITRWSTDEEAAALQKVLKEEGHKKLSDALGKEKETGFIRFPRVRTRFPSTRLNYARQYQDGDKRVIVLATDRPIGFLEAMNMSRSTDYDLSLIELHVDADGNGDGVLAVGEKLTWDADKNQVTAENYGISPVKLVDIKRQN